MFNVSIVKGLMWCLAILFLQLGLLRYVDLRVAAMPRLRDMSPQPGEAVSTIDDGMSLDRQSELDA